MTPHSDIGSMSDSIAEMGDTLRLIFDARSGELSDGQMTLTLYGDTPAEALGHAYHIRDLLRDEGYIATADYIAPADEQPAWARQPLHIIELTWGI